MLSMGLDLSTFATAIGLTWSIVMTVVTAIGMKYAGARCRVQIGRLGALLIAPGLALAVGIAIGQASR